ncbi:MAG: radical SAM protein [Oscillospiraceae bacterium]|nr:radical SAM protein [Oscillospiraceae bacterium]
MAKIIAAYIEITGLCNERCPYCYNEKLVSSGESLPLKKITDMFSQLKDAGVTSAAISGGEPFLHKNLPEILSEAKHMDFTVSIISNGKCFDNDSIDIITEYQPSLQLTFDGWNAEVHDITRGQGNFLKITHGVKTTRERGYSGNINLRLNLHTNNIDGFPEFLKMIEREFATDTKSLEISSITLAVIHRTESGGGNFSGYLPPDALLMRPEIAELSERWNQNHNVKITNKFTDPDVSCPYNTKAENVKCGLRIALDGNVFPCQAFTDDRFSIGSIIDEKLEDIICGNKLAQFIDAVQKRKNTLENCRPCAYKSVCSGGCPAMAFIEHGTLDAVSSVCASRKMILNKLFSAIMSEKRNSVQV